MADTLRQKAEELLSRNPEITPTLSTVEVQKLFHELNVHQIELQMQNEELRHAQEELAHSRDSFVELYDFAPVGYLILNPEARIARRMGAPSPPRDGDRPKTQHGAVAAAPRWQGNQRPG
jgi:hypothetical protein